MKRALEEEIETNSNSKIQKVSGEFDEKVGEILQGDESLLGDLEAVLTPGLLSDVNSEEQQYISNILNEENQLENVNLIVNNIKETTVNDKAGNKGCNIIVQNETNTVETLLNFENENRNNINEDAQFINIKSPVNFNNIEGDITTDNNNSNNNNNNNNELPSVLHDSRIEERNGSEKTNNESQTILTNKKNLNVYQNILQTQSYSQQVNNFQISDHMKKKEKLEIVCLTDDDEEEIEVGDELSQDFKEKFIESEEQVESQNKQVENVVELSDEDDIFEIYKEDSEDYSDEEIEMNLTPINSPPFVPPSIAPKSDPIYIDLDDDDEDDEDDEIIYIETKQSKPTLYSNINLNNNYQIKPELPSLLFDSTTTQQIDENVLAELFSNTQTVVPTLEEPPSLKIKLLQHQKEALHWMVNQEKTANGGILADDMGCGKTVSMISCMLHNHFEEFQKNLIIVPNSCLLQWEKEITTKCDRSILRKISLYYGNQRTTNAEMVERTDILLTTYGTLTSDFGNQFNSPLFNIKWNRIILDEAHYIKNRQTKVANATFQLFSTYRWCLTGTPIQNRLDDIYSLIAFIKFQPHCDLPVRFSYFSIFILSSNLFIYNND